MKKLLSIIGTFLITQANICLASTEINAEIAKSLKNNLHEPNIISTVASLFIVICLIYVTGIIYTKLNKFSTTTMKKQLGDLSDNHISILSTTRIGNNKSLHVIEVAGKKLLIGATQNSISLIDNLDSKANTNIKSFSINNDKIISEKISNKDSDTVQKEEKINEEDFGLYKKYLK